LSQYEPAEVKTERDPDDTVDDIGAAGLINITPVSAAVKGQQGNEAANSASRC